jgi:hypothetical protein
LNLYKLKHPKDLCFGFIHYCMMLKDELYWVNVCNEMKKTMLMKCKTYFAIYEGDTNKVEIMDIDTLTTSI